MLLRCEGFDPWRCDRSCQLGIHLEHMMKLLKCMASKDSVEMRYVEGHDDMDFVFKSANEERVSHFRLKLMDIDS